ncbi:DUF1573 domain-containing protein [Novosphingobium sp. FSY-8]|uniref:DUF1573 domain-containing protein n=1 Tax=Novosphingobium ovatum TaxID=1908523 RepID=A0ABW9XHJ2_9SPHN|nr:DUF1573 domain-containing protein [Novosphingobium ovatum]NBC38032.1 DUF1573 domain-containing protein [Novosphingobium ovatum]
MTRKMMLVLAAGLSLGAAVPVMAQSVPSINADSAHVEPVLTPVDFGSVVAGQQVVRDLVMMNDGKGPLVISNISTGCACIKVQFTREPIMPGRKFTLRFTFDSTGRGGPLQRTVTMGTNAPTPTYITLVGQVSYGSAEPRM